MKKTTFKPRRRHIALAVLIVVLVALLTGLVLSLNQKSPTSSGNIYMTPKSAHVNKGSDVTYTIRVTPGTPIDTVTATLTYDAAKLSYKSASYNESPFSVQIPAIKKTGSVMIQSAQFNGKVTNDSYIASLTFTALENGSPKVKLSGNAAYQGVATNPAINGKSTQTSSAAAQRATPWLIGILLLIVGVVGAVLFLIIRRRRHTLQTRKHKNIQEDTEKTDETA